MKRAGRAELQARSQERWCGMCGRYSSVGMWCEGRDPAVVEEEGHGRHEEVGSGTQAGRKVEAVWAGVARRQWEEEKVQCMAVQRQ